MKPHSLYLRASLLALGATGAIALAAPSCVLDPVADCQEKLECASGTTVATGGSAPGGQGGEGVGGSVGGGGTGAAGAGPGGGGAGGAPECMNDIDCTDAAEAHCDNGTCVPCGESPHCAGVTGLPVCDNGTCIECQLGEEDACTAPQTCDLLAKTCVDVAPLSVQNCRACTNDTQCITGHRCIPMDFPDGTPHGQYCLRAFPPACDQPFAVPLNGRVSISGAAAANYCGIEEDLATCEAVVALVQNWRCSGTDGMCSPDGILPEQPVPGAICHDLGGGALADRCTYACAGASECLSAGASATCGMGSGEGNGWCGG